jgi:DNA-binding PadR family transcriptional regulator
VRYGTIADDPGEEAFLTSTRAPMALLDSFVPLVQARALMAGVRHGVFEGLRDGPATADDLAVTLKLDPSTLLILLRVVASNGYVTQDGHGRYALSEMGRATLLADSPDRLIAWVAMMERLWGEFVQMGEVLRSGHGFDLHGRLQDAEDWTTYQAAMLENARRMAPFVAGMVPVKEGATRLLDIGGSHGLYGALIARFHPPMRSEVFDLPPAVEQSLELAAAEGITDVVTHRAGDALVDDLGGGYDVVLLSNILHHFTPPQIAGLLERVRDATTPGATVAIWELCQPGPSEPPELLGDAFALFFRMTSSARCYTTTEFSAWLTDAGFVDVQVQPFPIGRSLALVTGRAPD